MGLSQYESQKSNNLQYIFLNKSEMVLFQPSTLSKNIVLRGGGATLYLWEEGEGMGVLLVEWVLLEKEGYFRRRDCMKFYSKSCIDLN